ncbi:bifunctional enoyl-CoA hydratase/phosphate acetyltransferase [Ruegeria marina]|uniref:Phosphate acetyltransferase n=1 Tax=Ruegeria marina TaxID=639004 RepID=A0A1G6I9U5_9RHOB|nr:bifunctional enoyl-CoA hydratase/phosphate acetyltransferase [Ruegeria marina]SDC03153.1 phosphate acetyltransferase [Ruegeria marina]
MTRLVRNRPFPDLRVGDTESVRRLIAHTDIRSFVTFLGDVLEDSVDLELAADPGFRAVLSQGGMAVSLLVGLVATRLPGPGTRLRRLSVDIGNPLRKGDVAVAEATIAKLDADSRTATLDIRCSRADGTPILSGRIEAVAPDAPISRPFGRPVALETDTPPDRLEQIEELGRRAGPVRTAVVNPIDAPSLSGALDATEAGLITPVLIAPEAALRKAARDARRDMSGVETIDCVNAEAAARNAASLAAKGECGAIMKGKIHTDALLHAVLDRRELRTGRKLSHVFVEDVPGYLRLLFVADAAVNIAPDLSTLRDIVQNAIDLAHALGIERPRVAMLSAVETVTETIPSTIAAAAICKMADRGEITGADVDGPLAMDNAVSEQAARIKGIASPVAGRADILVAPDIEAANILAKDLDYLAGAEAAGIALGARVPIALTSRADTARERRASAALAAIMAAGNGHGGDIP